MAERPMLDGIARVHIVGVGGAGMSALARLLAGRGHQVTGSDAHGSATLERMSREGIGVYEGHRPSQAATADLVVASSAVPDDDVELAAAAAGGVPVWRRPALLEAITKVIPTIGATGTHGKTSSTAMLVAAARAAGADPAFVVGGELLDLGTNGGPGSDDLLILEVDEAFGTFEHVRLRGLMVTSVDVDHLDHFGTGDEIEAAFARVARAVDGPVVTCVDDPGAAALVSTSGAIGYGIGEEAAWRIVDPAGDTEGTSFTLVGPGTSVPVRIPRPGLHMARNAAGALALLASCGFDLERAAAGLATFTGVGRRWEERGRVGTITVMDDYAHHPTEVGATLDAALASGRRVVAVFQPHLYSRTELHATAFGEALARAGVVVVLDVYGAREAPVEGVDGRLVSDAVRRAGGGFVVDAPDRATAASVVAGLVEPGDLVVCMGAGDISELGDEVLGLLVGGS